MKKYFYGLVILIFSTLFVNTLYAQDVSNKLSMLEIVISNLVTRIDALEKRVNALEKNLAIGAAKAPAKDTYGKTYSPASGGDGFEDIGGEFFVKNVRFIPFGVNVLFTGEVANRSEKNYRFAKFSLEIYDDRDLLVKVEEFTIPDIPKNSVKSFEAMIVGVDAGLINRYVIKTIK